MAKQGEVSPYERELVQILEESLEREKRTQEFYRKAAEKAGINPETQAMFELLAHEEAAHVEMIQGRLTENRRRLAAIEWSHLGIKE